MNSTVYYSVQKRQEWEIDFKKNKDGVAASFARRFAEKIAEDMQHGLNTIEQHPFYPYTNRKCLSQKTRLILFFRNPKEVEQFRSIFDRYLPKEERLPPFKKWIRGIEKSTQKIDIVYFTHKFKLFYKTVSKEIKKQIRVKEISGIAFEKLSLSYCWNYHLPHQLALSAQAALAQGEKEKCRTAWLIQFRKNADKIAANTAQGLIARMSALLKTHGRNPMLTTPDRAKTWQVGLYTPSLMEWFRCLLPEKARIEPIGSWIAAFRRHHSRKQPHDKCFFDPLMRALLEKVAAELKTRAKVNGIDCKMYIERPDLRIIFSLK